MCSLFSLSLSVLFSFLLSLYLSFSYFFLALYLSFCYFFLCVSIFFSGSLSLWVFLCRSMLCLCLVIAGMAKLLDIRFKTAARKTERALIHKDGQNFGNELHVSFTVQLLYPRKDPSTDQGKSRKVTQAGVTFKIQFNTQQKGEWITGITPSDSDKKVQSWELSELVTPRINHCWLTMGLKFHTPKMRTIFQPQYPAQHVFRFW